MNTSLTISHVSNAHRNTLKTDTLGGIEGASHTMQMMEEYLPGVPWAHSLDHDAIKETSWGVASYFQEIMCATMIGKILMLYFMKKFKTRNISQSRNDGCMRVLMSFNHSFQ